MSQRIRATVQLMCDGEKVAGEFLVGWPPENSVFGDWHVLQSNGWETIIDVSTGKEVQKENFFVLYTISQEEIVRLQTWLGIWFLQQVGNFAVLSHPKSLRTTIPFTLSVSSTVTTVTLKQENKKVGV